MSEEGNSVSSATNCPPFFSLRSYRLIICILLLFANYFVYANTMGMNTAILCMVNSTLTVDRFNHTKRTCAVNLDEPMMQYEFAVPGTMHWSAAQQSMLISASYYSSCITVAFSGECIVADRMGPDRVLATVLLISTAVTLFTPSFAYADYNILVASRIIMGAIEGFMQPSISCLVSWWFPPGEKTIAAAIYSTGSQFAAGFTSLFASFLCRSTFFGGWPSIFYIFGGASTVFTIFWIILGAGKPVKNRWLNEDERKYLEKEICSGNNTVKRACLSRILLSSPVHSIVLCMFAFSFSTSITHAFLPMYLRELGLSIDTIGWYILTPFMAQIPGKLLIGPLIDYCTSKKLVSLNAATTASQSMGSFGAATALLMLAILPSCSNPTVAFYILIFYGFVYAGGTCGFYTSFLSISPENMGVLSTLITISSLAGSVASTSMVNTLTASATSYKWALIFASAALIQVIGGLHFIIFGTTDVQSW